MTRARGAGLGVVAGAALAIVIAACGAATMRPATSAAPPTANGDAMGGAAGMAARPDDVRAQIRALDEDLASRQAAAGAPAPTPDAVASARPMAMDAAAGVCARPASPPAACVDTCTLGDAICDDAASICRLADELPGDAWAADRCASGKASCAAARQRCCDCR